MRISILIFLMGTLLSPLRAVNSQPNILIITTDDQGYADLSCMGSNDIQTPNLDSLAKRGALCTAFYSNSPVCSPSRAALLTGRHPAQTGVSRIVSSTRRAEGLRPEVPTIASVLKSHGYSTFLSGKWHLGTTKGSRPMDRGFDRTFGFYGGCVDFYSHLYYWGEANPIHDLWENDAEVWHNGQYLTDLITDKAVSAIESAGNQPFFGYVAYNAPHYPMHAPAVVMEKFSHLPADRRIMAAMLSVVDEGVGRIMQKLGELGKLDNTLVFFMSDNGPSRENRNWLNGRTSEYTGGSAEPFRGAKFKLWEGGIRVPAIFSWPSKIPPNQTITTPLVAMDVFPTILAVTGIPETVPGLSGVNLLPVLRAGAEPQPRDLFWEYDGSLAVRRGDWKLLLPGEEGEMLVNLQADPGETTDLKSRNPEIARVLKTAATEWNAALSKK